MLAKTVEVDLLSAVGWNLQGIIPPNGHQIRTPIPNGRFQVGRRPDLNLCLPDPSVSKLHAEFVATDVELMVRDLSSTNGTFVNGRRITQDTPVDEYDIVRFAGFEFVIGKTCLDSTRTQQSTIDEWMQTLTQFQRLMSERAVVPHFQPIVQLSDGETIGYEVLARSILPGLCSPRDMFEAAERSNQAASLSDLCRRSGIEAGQRIPAPAVLFLNTHPSETIETGLLESLAQLRCMAPEQPIVLELHEAALTHPKEIAELRQALRTMDIQLAYDDFGVGQSRLQELAEVAPDYLKFDMSLIRDIHLSAQRSQFVGGLVRLALDLNILPLAEGIENSLEADVCRDLGFTHAQGYFYGKPAAADSWS